MSLSLSATTRRGRVPELCSPLLADAMHPRAEQHLGKVSFSSASHSSSLQPIIIIHRLLMETVMDVGDHRPGVNHRPVPAEPASISPWYYFFHLSNTWIFCRYCKYCPSSGRGDGELRRHFSLVHHTSDGLSTSILSLWVHPWKPTDEGVRDVGVALVRRCCSTGETISSLSTPTIV